MPAPVPQGVNCPFGLASRRLAKDRAVIFDGLILDGFQTRLLVREAHGSLLRGVSHLANEATGESKIGHLTSN